MSQTREALSAASEMKQGGAAALQLAKAMSLEVWPRLPTASSPHLALALDVMSDAIEALAAHHDSADGDADDHLLLPRLRKMRDLLDKAGAALRGLALRAVVTPLLRPSVTEALRRWSGAGHEGGGDEAPTPGALLGPSGAQDAELAALVSEGQAAVYSYVLPANVAHASKLLKALQVGPRGVRPFPDIGLWHMPSSLPRLHLPLRRSRPPRAAVQEDNHPVILSARHLTAPSLLSRRPYHTSAFSSSSPRTLSEARHPARRPSAKRRGLRLARVWTK